MSSQEIEISLTPQQAAHGVILKHTLPTGPARLRIPSCRDGDLVRVRVGAEEVPVRIRVAGAASQPAPPAPVPAQPAPSAFGQREPVPSQPLPAAPGQPAPGPAAPPKSGARGCLVVLGIAAAVVIGVVALSNANGGGNDSDHKASATAAPSYPADPYPTTPTYSAAPSTPTYSAAPSTPTYSAAPVAPSEAAPTPFDKGTCLNGELPDSTTAQRVSGVEEVSCSASDAHYRVIESIPMTSDLDRCNANPKTEYAFSYRYTLNGSVLNQYVYCLVGIGSYTR